MFVIFGCIVAKDYNKLAELYFEPPTDMTKDELADMLKARLQCAGPHIGKRIGRTAKAKKESNSFMAKQD